MCRGARAGLDSWELADEVVLQGHKGSPWGQACKGVINCKNCKCDVLTANPTARSIIGG